MPSPEKLAERSFFDPSRAAGGVLREPFIAARLTPRGVHLNPRPAIADAWPIPTNHATVQTLRRR